MKILLVEDDLTMQKLIRAFLENIGYKVRSAASAAEALRSFASQRPDLVLLDVGLPDENGFSVCRKIRAQAGENLPILFLTSRTDVQSRLDGFDAGAQDYIIKPCSLPELAARIGVHLRSKISLEEITRGKYELETHQRLRQDMTDMIVHDLKVPLTSIQATLQIVQSQGLISNQQFKNMLEISESAAGMMLLMINDLLDIARSEQAGLKPELGPVDLQALLQRLTSFFQPAYERRQLHFRILLSVPDPTVDTDQQLLFRILANLASNAMKFSPKGEEILLEGSIRGTTLRLTVSDRGPGVPDKDKSRIFEKFVQLPNQPLSRGSGIGLTFCRVAASALQGKVWVEDRPGGGSRFILELPEALKPAKTPAA